MAGRAGIHLIHCSHRECLTVYFRRVMDAALNRRLPWSAGADPPARLPGRLTAPPGLDRLDPERA